jgi:membrane-bound ClpP family serine protease
MEAGPPDRPAGHSPHRGRTRRAAWCVGAGVILGAAAVTCLALDAISAQQVIAIGLPGVLLIVAGLIMAVPDAATSRRLGLEAGLHTASFLSRLLSVFRRRGNGF